MEVTITRPTWWCVLLGLSLASLNAWGQDDWRTGPPPSFPVLMQPEQAFIGLAAPSEAPLDPVLPNPSYLAPPAAAPAPTFESAPAPECAECRFANFPCPSCKQRACEKATKKAEVLQSKAADAYKPVFYDNDFNYLNDPCYHDYMPADAVKRMELGCLAVVDVGGQYRLRHHVEHNHRGMGLTGRDDNFLLHRTRLFINSEIGDYFRVYAEMIDAESTFEDFAPRAIEVNRTDMQNLFLDVRLYEGESGALSARVGRQELIYGAQRLVSPLDWANTRRTFEGYKLFWSGDDWDIDGFYVRPVVVDPRNFDSPDYREELMGVYATCKALEDKTLDFYYFGYNTGDFKFDTWGARLLASREAWLFEVEGAGQSGSFRGVEHLTGAATIGLGRKLDDVFEWNPVLWTYYDYAAGDETLGNGFHHLFPLAHRYLGFMDLFGRRNVESFNMLLTLEPHKRVKLLAWYYYLWLENPNDVPYNVNLTPFNPGNQPRDAELGHEIDLMATITLNERANLVLGYSRFFAGDYYDLTPGVPTNEDADFYYTQFEFNF